MDGAQLGERQVTGGVQRQREYGELLVTDVTMPSTSPLPFCRSVTGWPVCESTRLGAALSICSA